MCGETPEFFKQLRHWRVVNVGAELRANKRTCNMLKLHMAGHNAQNGSKWTRAESRMSITGNNTLKFMLSWSRNSQAVKLEPMTAIWCKVDGVIFNDMSMGRPHCMAACWRSVFVTPESFKICMIFIAGCWVSIGNVWSRKASRRGCVNQLHMFNSITTISVKCSTLLWRNILSKTDSGFEFWNW